MKKLTIIKEGKLFYFKTNLDNLDLFLLIKEWVNKKYVHEVR